MDPGLHALGVAWWRGRTLEGAGYLKLDLFERPTEFREWCFDQHAQGVDVLVLERPVVYPMTGRFAKRVDPKWLMLLAEVIGAVALGVAAVETVRVVPSVWKGRVAKSETEAQVRAALTAAELARVQLPTRSLAHNVFDAIGLGLWVLTEPRPRRLTTPRTDCQSRASVRWLRQAWFRDSARALACTRGPRSTLTPGPKPSPGRSPRTTRR